MTQIPSPDQPPEGVAAPAQGRDPLSTRPGERTGRGPKLPMMLLAGVAAVAIALYAIWGGTPDRPAGDDLDAAQRSRPAYQPTPRPTLPVAAPAAPASVPVPIYQPLPAGMLPSASQPATVSTTTSVAPAATKEADSREAESRQRWKAPLMIGGAGLSAAPPSRAAAPAEAAEAAASRQAAAAPAAAASAPPPSFLDRASARPTGKVSVAQPEPMLDYKILEGKFISAVLETAIDSDMPGHVRAMVDEDVYGEAQRVVLLPRMTRLIGEYDTRIRSGQGRVLVAWRRAIRPDGATIRLDSYGADSLGRGGMPGQVDPHFMRRFGTAFLMSMVIASRQSKTPTLITMPGLVGAPVAVSYRDEAAEAMRDVMKEVLAEGRDVIPTVRVAQGSRIRVFVARDLDFSALAPPEHQQESSTAVPAAAVR